MAWKKPTPWHKRYHEDALSGYMNLSLEERGAYTTILDLLYRDGEPLADNEHFLAGWMQVSVRKYRLLRDRLLELGKLHHTKDGKLTNRRFEDEQKKADSIAESRVESAKIGREKIAEKKKNVKENNEASQQTRQQNPRNTRATLRDSEDSTVKAELYEPRAGAAAAQNQNSENQFAHNVAAVEDALASATGLNLLNPFAIDQLQFEGVSLELDVLPTVKAIMARRKADPPKTWSYFVPAIREAHQKRSANGAHPHPSGVPNGVVEDRERWEGRLRHGRMHKQWHVANWGPMPHDNGCRAPPDMLLPDDGKDWLDWYFDTILNRWDTKPKQQKNH